MRTFKDTTLIYPCFNRPNSTYHFLMKLFFFEFGNPKVIVYKGAETIRGRKLFVGGNYMRKYGK